MAVKKRDEAVEEFERKVKRLEGRYREIKQENRSIKEYLYILSTVLIVVVILFFVANKFTGHSVIDFSGGSLSGVTSETSFSHVSVGSDAPYSQSGYGLVAYYPFDGDNIGNGAIQTGYGAVGGTAVDYSSNNYDGTYTGNAATISSGCKYGRCAIFDGSGDYITLPNTGITGSNAESRFAWIKTTSGSPMTIFQYGNSGISWRTLWLNIGPSVIGGGTTYQLYFTGNNNDFGITTATTGIDLSDGNWHQVGYVYSESSTQITLYIDGVGYTGSLSSGALTTADSSDNFIGHGWLDSYGMFNGKLDDVMIFNHDLTGEQVSAIYSGTSPRFAATSGTHTFNVNLGTSANANITLGDYVAPSGTSIFAQINSSTTAGSIVEVTNGVIKGYTLPSGSLTSATLNLIYNTDASRFLSPVAGPNVSVEGYGTQGSSNTPAILHLKMNDNAATTDIVDSSGNGHTGTATTTTDALTTTGQISGALNFSATNSADLGDVKFMSGDFSLSMWMNANKWYDYSTIFGRYSSSEGSAFLAAMADGTVSFTGFDSTGWALGYYGGTKLHTDSPLSTGKWYLVTVVRSGTDYHLYLDGAEQSGTSPQTDSNSWSDASNTNHLFMATSNGWPGYTQPYDGSLDDARIYDYALNSSQIAFIYNSTEVSETAHYTMNGNSISYSVIDSSVNGYTGTDTINTSVTYASGKISGAFNSGAAGGQHITVPSAGWNDLQGNFTLSSWVNFNSYGSYWWINGILSKDAGSNKWMLAVTNDGNNLKWHVQPNGVELTSNAVGMSVGNWYNVGLTKEDDNYTFYFNGQPAGSMIDSYPIPTSSTTMNIGYAEGQTDAKIDDVRIYNTALNASQMTSIYNSGSGTESSIILGKKGTEADFNGTSGGSSQSQVVYYTLDDNAASKDVIDSSGNNHTGTSAGHTTDGMSTIGKINNALQFDGSTDYLTYTGTGLPSSGQPFSFSVWINTTAPSLAQPMITIDDGAFGNEISFGYNSAWGLYSYKNDGDKLVSSAFPTPNEWQLATLTYDGSSEDIYLNGNLVANRTIAHSYNSSRLIIGSDMQGNFVNGEMDDARIYKYALSSSQVSALYNIPEEVAHYTLDDNLATTNVIDSDGNYNGTATANTDTLHTTGKINGALTFNGEGSSNWITSSYPFTGTTSTYSLSAWIKPTGTPGGSGNYIIGFYGSAVMVTDNDSGGYKFGTSYVQPSDHSTDIPSDEWSLVTAVSNGTNTLLYVNGNLVATGDASPVDSGSMNIGSAVNGGHPFNGTIDDVRIYNYALNSSQISDLYNSAPIVDTTAPDVTAISSPFAYVAYNATFLGYHSIHSINNYDGVFNLDNGTLIVNATVSDLGVGMDSVYFNVTNSIGNQLDFIKASNPAGDNWNATLNVTKDFTSDGVYYITVYANDTYNNINNSQEANLIFYNQKPVITLASPANNADTTNSSMNFTFNVVDAYLGAGTQADCNLFVDDGSFAFIDVMDISSGTNTSTVSELPIGTHNWTVECWDAAGNHNISGTNFFTVSAFDTNAPAAVISSPQQNANYNTRVIDLNYSAYDDVALDKCWYSFDAWITMEPAQTCGTNWTGLTALDEGNNRWTVYVNDTTGNTNSTDVFFFVDSIAPSLNLTSPRPYANLTVNYTTLVFSANDSNEDVCNVGFDGEATTEGTVDNSSSIINVTSMGAAMSIGLTNWTAVLTITDIANGLHNWTVECFDLVGHSNLSETRYFNVSVIATDTSAPSINFTSPTSSGTVGGNAIYVNLSTSDIHTHYSFLDWDKSLSLWYRMDDVNASGDPTDSSSYSINGTAKNGAIQAVNGTFGKGFSFADSANAYIEVPITSFNNPTTQITVAAWVYNNQFSDWNSLIRRDSFASAGKNSWQMYLDAKNRTLFAVSNGTDQKGQASATNSMVDHTWYHLVGTYNGTAMFLYINGALNTTTTLDSATTNMVFSPISYLRIGSSNALTSNSHLNGSVDEVLIFNRSLSSSEVASLYNATANQYMKNFTALSKGSYTFTGYAVNSLGNKNQTETRTVTVQDTNVPVLTIAYPANASYAVTSLDLNYTASDETALGSCWYSLNGGANTSFVGGCGNNASLTVSAGNNNVFVYANDSSGNLVSSYVEFIVDLINPGINFTSPTSSGTAGGNSIYVNLTTSDANNHYSFVDFDNSLVGWLRGESNANDELGRFSGVWNGSAAYYPGRFGNAFRFEGGSGYVNTSHIFNESTFSASVWFKANSLANGSSILNNGYFSDNFAQGNKSWEIRLGWAEGSKVLACMGNSTDNNCLGNESTHAGIPGFIFADNWYQVVLTYNGSTGNASFYINGVRNWTDSRPNMNVATTSLAIGGDPYVSSTTFNGVIDDVLMFNRELTATEVLSLYNAQANKYENNFSSLAVGNHNFTGYAVDSAGNKNQTETRTVTLATLDTTAPMINLVYPANTTYNSVITSFNYSASDETALGSCWYSIDGGVHNVSIACGNNVTGLTASQGSNTWIVYVNDTSNNVNLSSVTFIVDTIAPQINFVVPTLGNGTSTTNTSVIVNVSINEANLDELKYNWNGTNYTMYNDSLVLMMNFENLSSLGENSTYVADLSRYGNNGIVTGAVWNNGGKYGGAMSFDGSSYITVPRVESNPISAFAWVKRNSLTNSYIISGKGDTNGWGLYISNNNLSLTQIGRSNTVSSAQINDLNWHFIGFTMNSSGSAFYVDGSLSSSKDYTFTPSDNAGSYTIGASIPNGLYFNGLMDEVQIYSRLLSAGEIQQLYMSNLQKFNNTQWYLYVNQSQNVSTGLSVGTYTYSAYAKDLAGNSNLSETRYLAVSALDTTLPIINVTSPTNTTYTSNSVIVNFTSSDNTAVDSRWFFNGTANITYSVPVTLTLANGQYTFILYSNDSLNNINSTSVTFVVSTDTTNPLISYGLGTENNNEVGADSIYVNTTWTETNFANVTFNLYNTTGLANSTTFLTAAYTVNWTGLSGGNYSYEVNITDLFGNKNSTGRRAMTLLSSCLSQCTEGQGCVISSACYLYSGMCSGGLCQFANLTSSAKIYTLYSGTNGNNLAINLTSTANSPFLALSGNKIIFSGKNGSTIAGTAGGNAGIVNITVYNLFNTTSALFEGRGGASTSSATGGNGGKLQINAHGVIRWFTDMNYGGTSNAPKLTGGVSNGGTNGTIGTKAFVKDLSCSALRFRDVDINDDGVVGAGDNSIIDLNYNDKSGEEGYTNESDINCDDNLNVIEMSRIGLQYTRGT